MKDVKVEDMIAWVSENPSRRIVKLTVEGRYNDNFESVIVADLWMHDMDEKVYGHVEGIREFEELRVSKKAERYEEYVKLKEEFEHETV